MNVSRRILSELPPSTIESLIGDSFFASDGFARLWEVKGGRRVIWTVEDSNHIAAILPGIEFGRKPLVRFMAMPDGCYGRLFFHPAMTADKDIIARYLLDAMKAHRYQKLFIYDFYHSLPDHSQYDLQTCETILVDISDRNWHPPDKKLQSQIRRAEREGIQVESFNWNVHHRKFLDLMQQTEKRHHRAPKYTPEFFHALAELAESDSRVQWVWCEYEGKPACSHIYLIENKMLQGWQIYFDKAFSFLKPNQYIRFMMCRRLSRQGIVTKLNLGGTPPAAEGLLYYKHRWGGESIRYTCFVMKKGLGRFL